MSLKKPNILVVGSFMMDLIASTRRVPNSGETVIGMRRGSSLSLRGGQPPTR